MFSPNLLVGYELSGEANNKTYIMAVMLKNPKHSKEITWYKDSEMLIKGKNVYAIRINEPGEYTVSVNDDNGIPHQPNQTVNIELSKSKTNDPMAASSSNNDSVSLSTNCESNNKINAVYRMENSEHFTIVVPRQTNESNISTNQAIGNAIQNILRGIPDKIKANILRDRSYSSLVTKLNKCVDNHVNKPSILNHFKRVVREAEPADLLSFVVKNEKANSHRIAVIDMRNRIRYVENRIEDSKDLDTICMILSDEEEAKDNLFGYYKNGENTNDWLPVPINSEVFIIRKHLKQNKFVTEGEFLFFIHESQLGFINLFDTFGPPTYVDIPSINNDNDENLWLCRTNKGNILIIDHLNERYLSIHDQTLSNDWISLFKTQKWPLKITPNLVYSLFLNESDNARDTERVIISVDDKKSICGYHESTITEYIMDPNKQHRFEYIRSLPLYVQIGINPIHHSSEETITYILVAAKVMNKAVQKYYPKGDETVNAD